LGLAALLLTAQTTLAQDPDESIDPHDFFDASKEPADEAFFHLERYFQIGLIGGLGMFTGGLGGTHGLGGAFGFNLLYFFDNSFAFELGFFASFQENALTGIDTTISASTLSEQGTTWLYVPNFNFRYYFPTNKLSRFLASINPYLVGGFDWVSRRQKIDTSRVNNAATSREGSSFSSSNFGVNLGLGISSLVYGDNLYLGMDIRFRYWLLSGEHDQTSGFKRSGDYMTFFATMATITNVCR